MLIFTNTAYVYANYDKYLFGNTDKFHKRLIVTTLYQSYINIWEFKYLD